jgi:hypothetical protein
VPEIRRQIFAYSGVLKPKPGDRGSMTLTDYAIGLAGAGGRRRVCYVPTAVSSAC